jgi:hypothetical protein
MESIDVLTSRVLRCPDERGGEKGVVLTIFKPFEKECGDWRCAFDFNPPIKPRNFSAGGVDVIQAFLHCLVIARLYFETTSWSMGAHWQGIRDCGLPATGEAPSPPQPSEIPPPENNPGDLEIFTARRLVRPDESGTEMELVLTVFKPFQADGETWKCGFAFGSYEIAPIRYGIGADFIEAMLDALSLARVMYATMVPLGWVPSESGGLLSCADLPFKIGRSFWI